MFIKRLNHRAVITEIPVKLIIIVIIMAIGFAIIFAGYRSFDYSSTENNLKAALNQLAGHISTLYSTGGPYSSETTTITIISGTFAKIESIKVGDVSCGENIGMIRYKITERPEGFIPIDKQVKVPVTTEKREALSFGQGQYTIFMQVKYDSTVTCNPEATEYIEISIK
mgnify:CR=1 FL=1